jgi:hypothetical protein
MFAQLILQFSELYLCFSQLGEKEKEKKRENGFPVGKPAAVVVPAHAEPFLAIVCDKLFSGQLLNFMCTLCISDNLVGKKNQVYLIFATTTLKDFSFFFFAFSSFYFYTFFCIKKKSIITTNYKGLKQD